MFEFIKKFLKSERVFKNYITSVLAVIVVAVYFGLVYTDKSSNIELTAILSLVGLLLRGKDTLIGIKNPDQKDRGNLNQ